VAHKTNAVRWLDQLNIPYELREYEVDPEDLAAETVAAKMDCRQNRCSRRWWRVETATESA
jgi:prolyl-tRNA editing enzyme YbaK/EbsC (Cys-tRNA(Pro) deacylase)